MKEIVFFLEEPSAEAMLGALLPRLLPADVTYRCIVFEGKQDLEKQLVRKMRGYRVPGAQFLVLRDQDSADCKVVKKNLMRQCVEANRPDAIVRIACHELESWYLADLVAVEKGLALSGLGKFQSRRQFSVPDEYPSPVQVLKNIVPSYQKISGSRAIGEYLDLCNKRSTSFEAFIAGIRKLLVRFS
jgi:hypothetical protein